MGIQNALLMVLTPPQVNLVGIIVNLKYVNTSSYNRH